MAQLAIGSPAYLEREWQRVSDPSKEDALQMCQPVVNRFHQVFMGIGRPADVDMGEHWDAIDNSLHRFRNPQMIGEGAVSVWSEIQALDIVWNKFVTGLNPVQPAERDLQRQLSNLAHRCIDHAGLIARAQQLAEEDPIATRATSFNRLRQAQADDVAQLHAQVGGTLDDDDFQLPAGGTQSAAGLLDRAGRIRQIQLRVRDMHTNVERMWTGNGQPGIGLRNALTVQNLLPAAVDPQGGAAIEAWMRTNRAALDPVTHLNLSGSGLTALPPVLPREMRSIVWLDIRENPGIILSEEAYNQFFGFCDALALAEDNPFGSNLQFTPADLRSIPFHMWLCRFMAPSMLIIQRLLPVVETFFNYTVWLGEQCICLAFTVGLVPLAIGLAVGAVAVVLTIPLILYDLLLYFVIAPVITLVRSPCSGRMIELN